MPLGDGSRFREMVERIRRERGIDQRRAAAIAAHVGRMRGLLGEDAMERTPQRILQDIASAAEALQGYELNEGEVAELVRVERDLDAMLDGLVERGPE